MRTQVFAGLLLLAVLLLVMVFTAGGARADEDAFRVLVENTSARITCGDYWLDAMPYERWAIGQGDIVLGTDREPYDLIWKMVSLCNGVQ